MKFINAHLYITVLIFLKCNPTFQSENQEKIIEKISYKVAVPLFDPIIKEPIKNEETVLFYYSDDIIIRQEYQLHNYFEEEKTNIDSDTVNMILTQEKYLSSFFVYKKDTNYGLCTDSNFVGKIILKDSFLNKKFIEYEHPRNYKNNWQLFFSNTNNEKFVEKYASKKINPVSLKYDTMILSFDKSLRDARLDISPFLDSLYSSKLYDLRLIVSTYFDSTLKFTIPRQEVYMSIEKQKVSPAETVFINKLIKEYKKSDSLKIKRE